MIQIHLLVENFSRAVLVSAIACLAAAAPIACAGSDFRPGESEVPRTAPNQGQTPAARPAASWELGATVPSMNVLADTSPSRGHQVGQVTVRVLANDAAAAALQALRPGDHMPAGAVLVAQHALRGQGTPDGQYAMVKRDAGYFPRGGDWEWLTVSREGNVGSRGKLDACARCHADAFADFVFPVQGSKP